MTVLKNKYGFDWLLPIGGVARVCRPASWAGPNPSKKPVNCLSDASFTPGNIKLKTDVQIRREVGKLRRGGAD